MPRPAARRRSARWQSGHAADCKSAYVGSIPARASMKSTHWDQGAGPLTYAGWPSALRLLREADQPLLQAVGRDEEVPILPAFIGWHLLSMVFPFEAPNQMPMNPAGPW